MARRSKIPGSSAAWFDRLPDWWRELDLEEFLEHLPYKEKVFVMVFNGDPTASARNAGYKGKGQPLTELAVSIMERPRVRYALKLKNKAYFNKFAVNVTRVMREESRIAFADPIDLFDEKGELKHLKDVPIGLRRAVQKVEVIESYAKGGERLVKYKYHLHDKGRALERVEKILGMYYLDNKQKADKAREFMESVFNMVQEQKETNVGSEPVKQKFLSE